MQHLSRKFLFNLRYYRLIRVFRSVCLCILRVKISQCLPLMILVPRLFFEKERNIFCGPLVVYNLMLILIISNLIIGSLNVWILFDIFNVFLWWCYLRCFLTRDTLILHCNKLLIFVSPSLWINDLSITTLFMFSHVI